MWVFTLKFFQLGLVTESFHNKMLGGGEWVQILPIPVYTPTLQCDFVVPPIKRWGLFLYLISAGLVTCFDQQNVKELTL